MKAKEPKSLVSVKVCQTIYEKVKAYKEKNYMPIGTFFEQAAEEKLKKAKK
jgi:hypothetical protein